MAAIAKVEPLTTARTLRGPFDYRLPAALAGVEVGSLLVVPFGRRRVLGVVVELAAESAIAPERLAAPVHALEQGVPPELVGLAHWIADEYCSTPARALNLVLPPGAGARAPELTAAQAAALAPVRDAIVAGRSERLLLHGVTGSGKTRSTSMPPPPHSTAGGPRS